MLMIQTWLLFFMVYQKAQFVGPLLFLVCINNLNQNIKFCKVYHFANDTNLFHFGYSMTRLNKYANLDMKDLIDWLNANKISLNLRKTELVTFQTPK